MAGLPTTLAGMIGFIIFVAFIVGMTVPNLNTSDAEEIKSMQTDFNNNLNASVNGSTSTSGSGFFGYIGEAFGINGIYDFIIGFFTIIISFAELVIAYLALFIGVSVELPTVFYVLFAILASSLIIGIVKLIFLNGD